jgi:putative intracellular protease/amidase
MIKPICLLFWFCLFTVAAANPILAAESASPNKVYVCPDCGCAADSRTFDKPGNCPECNMPLIEKAANSIDRRPSVAVLLFDGAEIIDYAGPWEAFGEAGFKVFTVAEKMTPIAATFGQKINPDYTFENSPAADVLLVPGGGVHSAVQNAKLIQWVQKNAQTSKNVMSVCTGAFILAKAGLLEGLTATTVSHAIDDLGKVSSKIKVVTDQRYVDNGKIITTAGLSSGIDGAFHLIAKIKGRGEAQSTALGMEYRWDPESKFARAALADRYFPEVHGVDADIVSTEGDVDHWEFKAIFSKPDSAGAIFDLLNKKIANEMQHTRGPVTVVSSKPGGDTGKSELEWKFTDEQGRNWSGNGTVEPSNAQAGKFVVTLKLAREQGGKST